MTVSTWKPLNCLSAEDWLNKSNIFMRQDLKNTVTEKKQVAEWTFFLSTYSPNNVIQHPHVCINTVYLGCVDLTRVLVGDTENSQLEEL